jgi:hypothetical protein
MKLKDLQTYPPTGIDQASASGNSPEESKIIHVQFVLPKWPQRIRARAGSERVTILDGRPVTFERQFEKRIPIEVLL